MDDREWALVRAKVQTDARRQCLERLQEHLERNPEQGTQAMIDCLAEYVAEGQREIQAAMPPSFGSC